VVAARVNRPFAEVTPGFANVPAQPATVHAHSTAIALERPIQREP
jgi:hypothetical protein